MCGFFLIVLGVFCCCCSWFYLRTLDTEGVEHFRAVDTGRSVIVNIHDWWPLEPRVVFVVVVAVGLVFGFWGVLFCFFAFSR